MSNANKVPVYAPGSTKPEYHTRLNAHDLVNGAGYTWKPGAEHTPAALCPVQGKAKGLEPAQRVLNDAGHKNDRTVGEQAGGDDDENEGDEGGDEPTETEGSDEPAGDETPAETETETPAEEAPAKPAGGRGRRKAS